MGNTYYSTTGMDDLFWILYEVGNQGYDGATLMEDIREGTSDTLVTS
jgi:hypothetical protein